MKKSLLFTIDFPPQIGGVAKYYENICAYLPSEKLAVLCQHKKNEKEFDHSQKYKIYRKILISRLWIWPKWIFSFFYLHCIIRKENIDVVLVGQILPLGTVLWLYKKIFKKPYAVFIHGMDISMACRISRKKKLAKKILKNAEFIIANSEYTKGLVIEQGIEKDKIKVVYPCVDTRICANENTDKRESNQLCQPVLLTVGRLVRRKGQDMVIKALPKVLEKFPELTYIIGGNGPDRKYLEYLAKKYNVVQNVQFRDEISDVEKIELLSGCDIFIMPSRDINGDVEGFGIVYLEASLYGKPVIAGRSGGVPEAVLDGETGILVNSENVDEIKNAIIKLLSNPVLANKFGVQGRERVLRDFNWDMQIEKIMQLLR